MRRVGIVKQLVVSLRQCPRNEETDKDVPDSGQDWEARGAVLDNESVSLEHVWRGFLVLSWGSEHALPLGRRAVDGSF